MNKTVLLSCVMAGAYGLWGCEKKAPVEKPTGGAAAPAKDDHDHDHDHDHADDHGHGPTTQLGTATAGEFSVKASRDGEIKAGSDAPIDVWVTGGTAKPSAVRFWIGTEDGKGSVKAKAELEKDNWHTHVEVPNPMPADAKLWVEIETDAGGKATASFPLNPAAGG